MKIYIAGKIGSAGVAAMRCYFDNAAKLLQWFNWETVNPCDIAEGDTWAACMVADLHALLDCDALYALANWKTSPGATVEVQLALRLGKPVVFAVDVLSDGAGGLPQRPIVCICPACIIEGAQCELCPFYIDDKAATA